MNYVFQVVPAGELTTYHSLLSKMEEPIDRHQALKLGACAVIVSDLSRRCSDGIAEEKRQLAVWVRNQRSTVRLMRFKGASKYRGALNADISNASDNARNRLEQLSSFAPEALRQAEQRFQQAARFVSLSEATAYVPTFQAEVRKKQSVQQTQGFALLCLLLGIVLLFVLPQIGLIILSISVGIWLVKRGEWQSVKDAHQARGEQIREIRERREVEAQFAAELDPNPPVEVDETVKPSIDAIARDLEKKYVFLDVACRDLNSEALSWEALATEVMDSMTAPEVPVAGRRMKAPPPPPPLPSVANSQERGESSGFFHHGAGDGASASMSDQDGTFSFTLSIEEIHQIMRQLGYKRLPSDLDALSTRAEERIGRFLAGQAGIEYEGYFWSYEPGRFTASPIF